MGSRCAADAAHPHSGARLTTGATAPRLAARKRSVSAIARERLARWLAHCERDHATPLVLVAVSHDERAGDVHVYRTEDGPSDAQIGALLAAIALRMRGA